MDDHTYRDVTKSPIEDVDTTSYDTNKELSSEETQEERAWLCEVYKHASIQENMRLVENLERDEAYMPHPNSTDKIEEHVWMQVLSTIDVSAFSRRTRFCNELGYDIEPILMIDVKGDINDEIEPLYWAKDEISIRDLSSATKTGYQLYASLVEDMFGNENDPTIDQENLEKVRELLSHRNEKMEFECSQERRLARKERRRK